MSKIITSKNVLAFNEKDWSFEIHEEKGGYRNTNQKSDLHKVWIQKSVYKDLQAKYASYMEDYKLLHDFRLECLPFGEYADCVLLEFLNKKHFKDETIVG